MTVTIFQPSTTPTATVSGEAGGAAEGEGATSTASSPSATTIPAKSKGSKTTAADAAGATSTATASVVKAKRQVGEDEGVEESNEGDVGSGVNSCEDNDEDDGAAADE